MGRKTRFQVKQRQSVKRKKRREKITKAGANPNDYYADGFCIASLNK